MLGYLLNNRATTIFVSRTVYQVVSHWKRKPDFLNTSKKEHIGTLLLRPEVNAMLVCEVSLQQLLCNLVEIPCSVSGSKTMTIISFPNFPS